MKRTIEAPDAMGAQIVPCQECAHKKTTDDKHCFGKAVSAFNTSPGGSIWIVQCSTCRKRSAKSLTRYAAIMDWNQQKEAS